MSANKAQPAHLKSLAQFAKKSQVANLNGGCVKFLTLNSISKEIYTFLQKNNPGENNTPTEQHQYTNPV